VKFATIIREEVTRVDISILDVREHTSKEAAQEYADRKALTLSGGAIISVEPLFVDKED